MKKPSMVYKMNLYEIEHEIMSCVDEETGEIIDLAKLEALEMERDKKIENIALYVKNLNADAAAYKAEKDSFAQRQKVAENKAASLKNYLTNFLAGVPYKSTRVAVSFRASETVDVYDMSLIPEDYLKFAEPTADKTAIKKCMKEGITIPGATLVQNSNIQIK